MKTRRNSVRALNFASCQNKTITTSWAVLSAWMTVVGVEIRGITMTETMKLYGKVFLARSRPIFGGRKQRYSDRLNAQLLTIYSHTSRGNYHHHHPIMCRGWIWVGGWLTSALTGNNFVISLPQMGDEEGKNVLKSFIGKQSKYNFLASSCVEFGPASFCSGGYEWKWSWQKWKWMNTERRSEAMRKIAESVKKIVKLITKFPSRQNIFSDSLWLLHLKYRHRTFATWRSYTSPASTSKFVAVCCFSGMGTFESWTKQRRCRQSSCLWGAEMKIFRQKPKPLA